MPVPPTAADSSALPPFLSPSAAGSPADSFYLSAALTLSPKPAPGVSTPAAPGFLLGPETLVLFSPISSPLKDLKAAATLPGPDAPPGAVISSLLCDFLSLVSLRGGMELRTVFLSAWAYP